MRPADPADAADACGGDGGALLREGPGEWGISMPMRRGWVYR